MSASVPSYSAPSPGDISALYEHSCKVALNFVRQYYTMLHTDPSQLHRFYVSQSAYVYGGNEADKCSPALGQREIQEKVDSLGFRDVHASIKQVDALPSGGNGILIQVTGELSTRGRPMRAFVQSFVLSQDGPKKYSIVADIFRYQEDGEPSEPGEEAEFPAEVGEDVGSGENGDLPAQEVLSQPISEQDIPVCPAVPAGSQPIAVASQDTELSTDWTMDEDKEPTEEHVQNGPEEYTADSYGNEDVEETTQESKLIPGNTDDDSESLEPQEPHPSVGEGQERETADPMGTRNMSYASISSKHVSPGANKMAEPRFTTRSYAPKKKPAFPVTSQISGREPRAVGPPLGPYRPKTVSDATNRPGKDQLQIFVGGLPKDCHAEDLKECFSPHGNVTDVRIHPNGYAFVAFQSEEQVARVIEMDRTYKIGPNNIRVERKGSGGNKAPYPPRRAPVPSKSREAQRGPLPPKY